MLIGLSVRVRTEGWEAGRFEYRQPIQDLVERHLLTHPTR
jgi:hypothetical protein